MGKRMKRMKLIAVMLFVAGAAWAGDAAVEAAPWWVDKLIGLVPVGLMLFVLFKPAHAAATWLRAHAAKIEAVNPGEAKIERGVATLADGVQGFVEHNQYDIKVLATDPEKRAAAEQHLKDAASIQFASMIDKAQSAAPPAAEEKKS